MKAWHPEIEQALIAGEMPEELQALYDDVLARLTDGRPADQVDRWAAWETAKEMWRMRRWGDDTEHARKVRGLRSSVERRAEDWEEAAHLARVRKQSVANIEHILAVVDKVRPAQVAKLKLLAKG